MFGWRPITPGRDELIPAVWGAWIGIRPWVSATPTINYPWKTFAGVTALEGCTSAQDEVELGSRVCAALCKANCVGSD